MLTYRYLYRYRCPSYSSGVLSNCPQCDKKHDCYYYQSNQESVPVEALSSTSLEGSLSDGVIDYHKAYAVAVAGGYQGTEQDWIAALSEV